ncbi:MAG: phage holin family protein [Marmoricola sp.]
MRFLSWLAVNALALGAAVWLFDGITLTGDTDGDKVLTLVVVGAIFGLVTSFIRPIVNLLSLPLIILTLGLMLLVVNALMLLLTSKIAETFDLGFNVDGFWVALFGSIVISIASMLLEAIFPTRRTR